MFCLKMFALLAISVFFVPSSEAANIIGLYTIDMKSHYFIAQNFLKELANNGHSVTIFTGFKSNNLPPNYKEVYVEVPSLDGKRL